MLEVYIIVAFLFLLLESCTLYNLIEHDAPLKIKALAFGYCVIGAVIWPIMAFAFALTLLYKKIFD